METNNPKTETIRMTIEIRKFLLLDFSFEFFVFIKISAIPASFQLPKPPALDESPSANISLISSGL